MNSLSPSLRVSAAIIRREGRVLLARRLPDSHLGGYWEFPGGKIEEGETPEECLARELEEEFGVAAEVGRFVRASRHDGDGGILELLAYEARLAPGEWVLESHDAVEWVPVEELLDWRLAPVDVAIARELAEAGASPAR